MNRSACARTTALVLAALLGAALPAAPAAARPDVNIKLDKGKPNPDGSGSDYAIEYKIKRKDGEHKVPITIPGGGCTAKKKGELIADAINKQLGKDSCHENNGSIRVRGSGDSSVLGVERKKDGTGEKDTIKGVEMQKYALNFQMGPNEGTWVATGTRFDDVDAVVPGSWLTVGVAGILETTVDVQAGMSVSDVIGLAFDALKNDESAPTALRDALSLEGGVMSFDAVAAGYDENWEYVIQSTDIGLQGGEWFGVGIQEVPTPGTAALLGLGCLVASRRRR